MFLYNKANRKKIEAAFTQFDNLGEEAFIRQLTDYHKREGRAFKVSRKYWVRATRGHRRSIYNFMLIRAHADDCSPTGGWTPSGSCTYLHNSGYIVVDKSGDPIVRTANQHRSLIPSSYNYLLDDEDRIIAVANTYYIEPARDNKESSVEINDFLLAKAIGPTVKQSEVNSVLRSSKFQTETGTKIESSDKIIDNSTENFTFIVS